MTAVLQLHGVHKTYRLGAHVVPALQGVDLSVAPGEMLALTGPSGSGKSTILNLAGLIDRADAGRVTLRGRHGDVQVDTLDETAATLLRRDAIGFVFQSFNLIDELTVFENVELPLIYLGVASGERQARVEKVLDKMQIMHRRNHYPQQLSGGQQQRVAISRAVINQPKLILADEPTGNLDTKTSHEIMDLFEALYRQGNTIIMVTHEEDIARYAHRIIRLRDGLIESDEANEGRLSGTVVAAGV